MIVPEVVLVHVFCGTVDAVSDAARTRVSRQKNAQPSSIEPAEGSWSRTNWDCNATALKPGYSETRSGSGPSRGSRSQLSAIRSWPWSLEDLGDVAKRWLVDEDGSVIVNKIGLANGREKLDRWMRLKQRTKTVVYTDKVKRNTDDHLNKWTSTMAKKLAQDISRSSRFSKRFCIGNLILIQRDATLLQNAPGVADFVYCRVRNPWASGISMSRSGTTPGTIL